MTDRCSFCFRADLPLVRAKHAATCLECARLAVEVLAAPAKTIHCERDCDSADAKRCGECGQPLTTHRPVAAGACGYFAPCPRGGHGHPCALAPGHAGDHSTPGCGGG
jgi:hypothetical protein